MRNLSGIKSGGLDRSTNRMRRRASSMRAQYSQIQPKHCQNSKTMADNAKRSREDTAVTEVKELYRVNRADDEIKKLRCDFDENQKKLSKTDALLKFAEDHVAVVGAGAKKYVEDTIFSCRKQKRRLKHDAGKIGNKIVNHAIFATIEQVSEALELPYFDKDNEADHEDTDYSDSEEE